MTRNLKQTLLAFSLAALALDAAAQAFPSRPLTFIWPYAAGTRNGEAFRQFAAETGRILGQPMTTEFRGGAGARLGAQAVMKAPADGYLVAAAPDSVLVLLPHASSTFRAEPMKDYVPVMIATEAHSLVSAHSSVPFRDVKGLVEYAKANPGKLTYASPGVGANSHLYFERFQVATGVQLVHVPYKGTGIALQDRLAGRVHLSMGGLDVKPHVDSGKLVALATTGPEREKLYPNTPTLSETYPGMVYKSWFSFIVAPGTPQDIVSKLYSAFSAALKTPEVRKTMEDAFWRLSGAGPEEFMTRWKAENETYGPLIKKLGLNLD